MHSHFDYTDARPNASSEKTNLLMLEKSMCMFAVFDEKTCKIWACANMIVAMHVITALVVRSVVVCL